MSRARLDPLKQPRRVGQFLSVGVTGFAIETTVVAALTTASGTAPLVAKLAGAELSIFAMFVLNDRWTFAGEGAAGVVAFVHRWLKSHAVRVVGLSVGFLSLWVLTGFLDVRVLVAGTDLWPTVANAIGIAAGMGINYVAETLFTWGVDL